MPDASGLDFSGGDVRHPSAEDAATPEAIAATTRELAHRDNMLAKKVDEVIEKVNNNEQFIPVQGVRTTLPPNGGSEVVTNFRIPPGFEARVLNAIVSPAGTSSLEVFYNKDNFGSTSGEQVLVTTNEFSTSTMFYESGEFVVRMANNAPVTQTLSVSLVLTMRPVGPQAGGILGPGSTGPRGPRGFKGEKGGQGLRGLAGPKGDKSLVWRGVHNPGSYYRTDDVVRYQPPGKRYSTYVAVADGSATLPPTPPAYSNSQWEIMAEGGEDGSKGDVGDPGSAGNGFLYRGEWSEFVGYPVNDVVVRTIGSIQQLYFVGSGSATAGTTPESGDPWVEVFAPSYAPVADYSTPAAQFITLADYTTNSLSSNPNVLSYSAGSNTFNLAEYTLYGGPVDAAYVGTLQLTGGFKARFAGTTLIKLPSEGRRAWANTEVACMAYLQGVLGNGSQTVSVQKQATNYFAVTVHQPQPVDVQLFFTGISALTPADL